MSSFGTKEVLIDAQGEVLHTFSDRDLREGGGGGRGGRGGANNNDDEDGEREAPRRDIRWRPGVKGMSFLQAVQPPQDEDEDDDQGAANGRAGRRGGRGGAAQGRRGGGAPAQPQGRQGRGRGGQQGPGGGQQQQPRGPDRVMLWKPPFGDDDVELVFESPTRINSVEYSQDGRWMFLTRTAGRNNQTIHAVDLQNDKQEYQVFRGRGGGGAGRGGRGGRFGRGERRVDPESALDSYAWDYAADETWASPYERTNFDSFVQDQDDQKQDDQQGDGQQGDDQKQDSQKQDDTKQDDKQGDAKTDGDQDGDTQDGDAQDGDQDDQPQDDQDDADRNRGVTRGTLMTTTSIDGERVVRVTSGGDIYFNRTESSGDDEEEEDAQPDDGEQDEAAEPPTRSIVIEKFGIVSGDEETVFESEPINDWTVSFVDAGGKDELDHFYTSRQSTDNPPDFFMYVKGKDGVQQLTHNKNFTPWFQKLETERFQVTRVDGFKFWVTVTKNPDHGEKLPAMFWFYPREYTDQEAYDRSARGGRGGAGGGGPGRFRQPSSRSMAHLTQLGYVIVEPDIPIVGPEGRMNDNYVQDLRNGLWAVIDELDKRRIIDRDRMGIGGHSYGAFSTANAMAHTPFFKAGIAGDGNYNRTLTPMAFQAERRYFWDARETYVSMSPMFWANQVNGALLMYHGAEDANVGTHPINSERMFAVLDGLGKPAAMYMYPYEDHGPIGKETTLDMWARWVSWLDKYVKNPAPPEVEAEADAEEGDAELFQGR